MFITNVLIGQALLFPKEQALLFPKEQALLFPKEQALLTARLRCHALNMSVVFAEEFNKQILTY
jgi:hypothetical protein